MFAFGSLAVVTAFDGIRKFLVSAPEVRFCPGRSRFSAPQPSLFISQARFSGGQSEISIPQARLCKIQSGFSPSQSSDSALQPGALFGRQGDSSRRRGFSTGGRGAAGEKTSTVNLSCSTVPFGTSPKSLICPFFARFQPSARFFRGSARFSSAFPVDGLPGKTKQNNNTQ